VRGRQANLRQPLNSDSYRLAGNYPGRAR